MDNSRSLEALYQDGTGMVSLPKKSYKASIEGYDGFDDILSADLAKSEENLAFLDTFQMIEAKNAADKIKMCKKLSANYGTRSDQLVLSDIDTGSLCRDLIVTHGCHRSAMFGANKVLHHRQRDQHKDKRNNEQVLLIKTRGFHA